MYRFILKRLLMLIPVLLGVSFIVYTILSFTPGDPVQMMLGDNYSEESYAAMQEELGLTYLFIAHDLSMVKYISDRIGVLHLGHLLETGTTEEIFEHPIHPYTRSLLSAIPLPNPVVEKRRVAETYDYAASGIDYSLGTSHHVAGSHYVKCTDAEFAQWCR